jgi:uncharacterized membrane protein YedE/YeeE
MLDGDFTPAAGAIGGVLIALALAGMLIGNGKIAGLSGVCAGLVGKQADRAWQVWFVVGMLAVGVVAEVARPSTFDASARVPVGIVALAGALVGVGTRLANGCTSGHGLYGMARLSKRSIVATVTFMAVAVATATLVGRWI